jgi:hypothetical protein
MLTKERLAELERTGGRSGTDESGAAVPLSKQAEVGVGVHQEGAIHPARDHMNGAKAMKPTTKYSAASRSERTSTS